MLDIQVLNELNQIEAKRSSRNGKQVETSDSGIFTKANRGRDQRLNSSNLEQGLAEAKINRTAWYLHPWSYDLRQENSKAEVELLGWQQG